MHIITRKWVPRCFRWKGSAGVSPDSISCNNPVFGVLIEKYEDEHVAEMAELK